MSDVLLDHLNRDTVPSHVLEAFVSWCIWEQARPALMSILDKTGLQAAADALRQAHDLAHLQSVCQSASQQAHEARRRTGPLGLSTAEAAANLMARLARSASEADFDAEGVAFFAAQIVGWAGFAESGFSDSRRKMQAEDEARQAQEARLRALWRA
ncbi:MAG: hypothetical protein NZ750_07840 [Anaerolineae bacterium]|nr:hypothetical protein [Anaerolineae bacterium]MDW8172261.1 hypothetical protein [Anaerolineae bacterium]